MATAPTKRRTTPAPPAQSEIVAAIQALSAAQSSADDRGMLKHASTIIVAVILALVLWVGATLLSLNTTVTRMSANVDVLSKTIDGLQTGSAASGKTIGDLQAMTARQDARANAIEADVNRVKERVRMLEGQKPLDMDRVRGNGER